MISSNLKLSNIYELYEKDEMIRALDLCDKVIDEHKSDNLNKSIALYYKGLIYEDKCDYDNAIKYYKLSVNNNKEYAEPLLRQYEVYRKLNYLNKAYDVIEEYIRLHEDEFYGYDLKFNFLFNMRLYQEAEEVIKECEEEFEYSDVVLLNKVKVYVMLGRLDEALKIIEDNKLNEGIELDLLLEKSKILAIKEELNESLKILLDINSRVPNNNEIIYLIASIYMIKGRLKDAKYILKPLIDIEYCEEMSYLLCLYYYGVTIKEESLKESEEYFSKLLRRYNIYSINDPNNLNILLLRGICNYEIKDYKEALRITQYIESITTKIDEVEFLKALVYKDTGNVEKYEEIKENLKAKNNIVYKFMVKIEEVKL